MTEEFREAFWENEFITFRPGVLYVALARGMNGKMVHDLFIRAGFKIDYKHSKNRFFRVFVPKKETLSLASKLIRSSMFVFVKPEIISKENED